MKKGNKTKGMFGTSLRRSEFDDELLRDNMRTNNRLKTEMQYHDTAHRVIMKDIGKETHLLQSKLENDRRDSSFGINGYKFGTTSLQLPRRYSYDSSIGSPLSADSAKNATHNFNKGGKRHSADVKMMADKDSDSSQRPTMHISKSSDRLSNLSTRYPSAKVESDDFLSTVLNEAMKDELLYTRSPQRICQRCQARRTKDAEAEEGKIYDGEK